MVGYLLLTDYDILIELDDGNKALYDDFDKTYRILPYDINNLSKESYGIEFGKRLTTLMDRKGISQYELSQRSGISQASISGYINGKRIPDIYIFCTLLSSLHCSDDEIRFLDIL
jgi:hypothetical protein